MKTLRFANGDRMPMLGLGTWKSAPGEVYRAVREALRIGYRHIDCAPIYGNEAEIGRALSDAFREGVVRREQLWITSKLWNDCHAPVDGAPALARTLADLRLDYLDLYLMHWPVAQKKGVSLPESGEDFIALEALPVAVTWKAMEALTDQSLCRHVGVSNFSLAKLRSLLDGARRKPEMNQVELHPYLRQGELLDFCGRHGVHLTAYAPLGSPDRSAAMKKQDEPVLLEDSVIKAVAARHGVTPAQVLIGWAMQRGTAVIPKSVNPERLRQNLAALHVSLTREDMRDIAGLDRHRRYISGDFWAMAGSPYTLTGLWDE